MKKKNKLIKNNIAKYFSLHDRFFRHMMTKEKIQKEFFAYNLPTNIKSMINLDTLKLQPDNFIDNKLNMQVADLLFIAELNNDHSEHMYLLVEHLSKPHPLMPLRLFKYMLEIIEHHLRQHNNKTFPIIFPMIIYAGRINYNYSTDFFAAFAEYKTLAKKIWLNAFHLIDLTKTSDKKLKRNLLYGTIARIMKHAFDSDINVSLKSIVKSIRHIANQEELDYIDTAFTYIINACEIKDKEKFQKIIKTELSSTEEKTIMTIAEMYKQEGKQEGMRKGKQEGKQEGRLEALKQVAFTLAKNNTPPNDIIKLTGLSKKEIEKIIK